MNKQKVIAKILSEPTYDFLREEPVLKEGLCFVCLSGSRGYGTNTESSDYDFRGVCMDPQTSLLGVSNFEQFQPSNTDMVVYGLKRYVQLALQGNPNIIEMLGLPEDYYIFGDSLAGKIGKALIDSRGMFLSKQIGRTFCGYAYAQLKRIQICEKGNDLSDKEKNEYLRTALQNSLNDFNRKHENKVQVIFKPMDHDGEGLLCDFVANDYETSELCSLLGDLNNIVKTYRQVGARNNKPTPEKMCKHAMHVLRILLTGKQILSEGVIQTNRVQDLDLLLSVRSGKYMDSNGKLKQEFFDLADKIQTEFYQTMENSALPDKPNFHTVQKKLMEWEFEYLVH